MEKIYVLLIDDCYDFETKTNIFVFKDIIKAKDKLKEMVKSVKVDIGEDLENYTIEEDDEMGFCIFIEGEYTKDHYSARISTHLIEE